MFSRRTLYHFRINAGSSAPKLKDSSKTQSLRLHPGREEFFFPLGPANHLLLQCSSCLLYTSQLRLQILQVLNHALVVIHDFVNKIDAAEQIGKAGGLKDDFPIGHCSVLFHGPHPLAKQLILGLLFFFRLADLLLRLRDQCFILADLHLSLMHI